MRFSTTVQTAHWQENSSHWRLVMQKRGEAARIEYVDILVSARGFLSKQKWPAIAGLYNFKGEPHITEA